MSCSNRDPNWAEDEPAKPAKPAPAAPEAKPGKLRTALLAAPYVAFVAAGIGASLWSLLAD